MSIMSGLVETGSQHSAAPGQSILGEWVVRRAWSLVIAGSVVFWVALAVLLMWG